MEAGTKFRTMLVLVVVFCICCRTCTADGQWNKTISVSPQGLDTLGCGSQSMPCRTLHHALETALQTGINSTRILLKPGTFNLSTSFNFTRIQDFAICGEGTKEDVVIKCPKYSANASLAFRLATNIVLQGFTLLDCGGWHASSVGGKDWDVNNPMFISAVFINYCRNLQITDVEVKGTRGVGVNAYCVSGFVQIVNSTFIDNVPLEDNHHMHNNSNIMYVVAMGKKYAKAGGGMFITLGNTKYNPMNISKEESMKYTAGNGIYIIKNCTFMNNTAPTPNFKMNNIPSLPFSRGGGLAIFSASTAANNSIFIESCQFTGNRAVWGGGLQIEFQVKSQNNTIRVTSTSFENNYAHVEGGGIRIATTVIQENPKLLPNYFYFTECQITDNYATWGGGLTTYGYTYLPLQSSEKKYQHGIISFKSCLWERNQGTVGAAIGALLVNLNEDDIGPGVPYKVILDNCTLTNNRVVILDQSVVVGQGAIYSDEVPLVLKNNVSITNNTNTSVVLDSATLEISDYVRFVHNSGYRGGALALFGTAKIVLMKQSHLLFHENTCEEKGGAMYVSGQGPPLVSFNATGTDIHKCFFTYEELGVEYDKWDTEIIFQANGFNSHDRNSLGRSVFASSLGDCRRVGESRGNNTVLEWKFVKYLNSAGHRVGIKGEVVTDPINIRCNPSDWKVSPSQVFNATIKLIDEKENEVFGIIHVGITGKDSKVQLGMASSLFLVYDKVENLVLLGRGGDIFTITLRTVGGQLVHRNIEQLTLKNCFPGFKPKDSKCVCSSDDNSGIYNCSTNNKEVFIKEGYWAGIVSNEFKTYLCPESYCRSKGSSGSQDGAYLYEQSEMCGGNRDSSSILCGSCKPDYTVLIGDESCSADCNNLYLLTIIPYAVILFLAVMVIMAINLDVFTGYLNAWLYSYQVMNLLLSEGFSMDPFMNFIIGLANIQVKTGGSCLLNGIDDADKLAIMYILPTYVLLSVFVLAKIVRAYPGWCYSRHVKAPFRAFCTLFVLCYTNITGISLKILHPAKIGHMTVLYQEGAVEFFQGKHIGYAILAIIYLILVVIPFPLTLMFTPFFTKCLRPVFNLNNLKPFYDAYQGCFKDEYRWYAAFYFVCRFYLLVISTYVQPGPSKRAVLEASCMLILVVFVYVKPYKQENKWINRLDAVLLTNLSFITILSSALQDVNHSQAEVYRVIIKMLAYVPLGYLVYLVVYLAYNYREYLRVLWAIKCRRESSTSLEQISDVDQPQFLDNKPDSQQLQNDC